MAVLTFSPRSVADLSAIHDFIARDKPLAALKWIDMLEDKCKLIASNPNLGERRHEFGTDVRSSLIGRYVIFYRPVAGGVEVMRVIAGDRDIRSL